MRDKNFWFRVNRKAFAKTLQGLKKLVPTRTPYPVITNVKAETKDGKLYLTVTDLDIYIKETVDAEIGQDWIGLLPIKPLTDTLKNLNGETVTFTIAGEKAEELRFFVPPYPWAYMVAIYYDSQFNREHKGVKSFWLLSPQDFGKPLTEEHRAESRKFRHYVKEAKRNGTALTESQAEKIDAEFVRTVKDNTPFQNLSKVKLTNGEVTASIPLVDPEDFPRMFEFPEPPTAEDVQAARDGVRQALAELRKHRFRIGSWRRHMVPLFRKYKRELIELHRNDEFKEELFVGLNVQWEWVESRFKYAKLYHRIIQYRGLFRTERYSDWGELKYNFEQAYYGYKSVLDSYLQSQRPTVKAKPQPAKAKPKKPKAKKRKKVKKTTKPKPQNQGKDRKHKEANMSEQAKPTVKIDGETYQVNVDKVHALIGNTLVATKTYRGRRYIDVRKIFTNCDPEIHFTSKGLMIDAEKWKAVLPAILQAVAEELGITHSELLERILSTRTAA